MTLFLKWYLIGCAVSLIFQLMFMATSNVVKVSNVLGYFLNTALSWGYPATLLLTSIVDVLNKKHWNKTLWTSKLYKEAQQKAQKQFNQKHPGLRK